MICRICASECDSELYQPREMMFGTRQEFGYLLCSACSTLQIAEIPDDLGQYYSGSAYYSFNQMQEEPSWKTTLKRMAAGGMVGYPDAFPTGAGFIDKIRRGAEPWTAHIAGLTRDAALLDVGCGEGARLHSLERLGFTNLTGIDAFLPDRKAGRSGGITLIAGELSEHDGAYDCITMHHSLEHVPDPAALLTAAKERLKPGGAIYVRIPLFQNAIWAEHGVNWAQIDPPRHLYLLSADAFLSMAQQCGLTCERQGTDTLGWSLAWSHAYARDIAMYDAQGVQNPLPFTVQEITAFDRKAAALNSAGKGDQGYFVLRADEAYELEALYEVEVSPAFGKDYGWYGDDRKMFGDFKVKVTAENVPIYPGGRPGWKGVILDGEYEGSTASWSRRGSNKGWTLVRILDRNCNSYNLGYASIKGLRDFVNEEENE